MCGFSGFLDPACGLGADELARIARQMAQQLQTRGPDDEGEWVDERVGIGMGFRRLSILDLSAAGHQPMASASGNYVILFNGEIYSAPELRAELEKRRYRFRGHSDTEVLLAAFDEWGISRTLPRLVGMFAIAVWDVGARKLRLIRDRMGIKPLYWGRVNGVLFFGSQPKAFFPHPRWSAQIDTNGLTGYFRFGYVPDGGSIYRGIEQVEPGTVIELDTGGNARIERYWDLADVARRGMANGLNGGDAEQEAELLELLKTSVKMRLLSDVPVGAFLSGGIDSSLIVALMQELGNSRVRTFSIGSDVQEFDEADHARRIANHLGTDHTELYVSDAEARDVIPGIPEYFDEPFADSSQIPTYLVSRLARKDVTVILSGDGADELFGGYPRYAYATTLLSGSRFAPKAFRAPLSAGLGLFGSLLGVVNASPLPKLGAVASLQRKLDRARRMIGESDAMLYRALVSHWHEPDQIVVDGKEGDGAVWSDESTGGIDDYHRRIQLIDMLTYLPNDILAKVDRASMANCLEARVPYLDHRVVELSWRLPGAALVDGRQGKRILRKLLQRYVPRDMFERPKMGFGVPIGEWLKGPLREWAESLISADRLRREGVLNPAPVSERWNQHLRGEVNWQYPLWTVLMFQLWKERWIGT